MRKWVVQYRCTEISPKWDYVTGALCKITAMAWVAKRMRHLTNLECCKYRVVLAKAK